MVVRYFAAGAIALTITFGLFYVMQTLISMGSGKGANLSKGNVIEFVRLKRESELQVRKRQLPKKEKPPEPPPPPDLQMSAPDSADSGEMAFAAPAIDINPDVSGGINLGTAPSDTDTVPLVRVPAQYPMRAKERGIEGYVVVRFTISAAGTTKDVVVVDSKPARIFDRAAVRSVKKWKYKPKIEDGVAVERAGIEVKVVFNLDDA